MRPCVNACWSCGYALMTRYESAAHAHMAAVIQMNRDFKTVAELRDKSTCSQIDETQQEERGEYVEQPVLLTVVAGGEVKHGPGDDAEAEAIGDRVSERNENQR